MRAFYRGVCRRTGGMRRCRVTEILRQKGGADQIHRLTISLRDRDILFFETLERNISLMIWKKCPGLKWMCQNRKIGRCGSCCIDTAWKNDVKRKEHIKHRPEKLQAEKQLRQKASETFCRRRAANLRDGREAIIFPHWTNCADASCCVPPGSKRSPSMKALPYRSAAFQPPRHVLY